MEPVRSLSHVGIAVPSIAEARGLYEGPLGARFEGLEEVPSQKVRVAFFRVGEVRLELLEPTDPESPVAKILEKRGTGVHHLAFQVDELEQRIPELQAEGVQLIEQAPRPGAHATRIAFLHPKATGGVLMELCQEGAH